MKPSKRNDEELLAWARSMVERAQKEKVFGTVTIHLEDGVIVRAKTERNDKPPGVHATLTGPARATKPTGPQNEGFKLGSVS